MEADNHKATLVYKITFIIDILYMEELEEQHSDLPGYGLRIEKLSSKSIAYAIKLRSQYRGPSDNDFFAFVLSKQACNNIVTRLKSIINQFML